MCAAHTPLVIIIRDGWGENPHPSHDSFNAIKLAETPVAARLHDEWPTTLIRTCGEDVGLPAGTMGNSEVGHQNIGAGRIVDQEILRITRTIRDGSFFTNPRLIAAFEHARVNDGAMHLLGLLSNGRVHSDIEHLFALLDLAGRLDFPPDRLFVHVITDGRDTPPRSGMGYLSELDDALTESGIGRIASVMGRYYALDRDHRWDRVSLAYSCLTGAPVKHTGPETEGLVVGSAESAEQALLAYYENPTEKSRSGDEFVVPTRIEINNDVGSTSGGNRTDGLIRAGDGVLFFNYRGDRPRELTQAFVLDDARWSAVEGGGFDRGPRIDDLYFCTMTAYEEGLPVSSVAFPKPAKMPNILGQIIAEKGLTQFRCAETEKFPHVTFFFNDYREEPFDGEQRLLVPSPRDVSTYDQKPEMSAQSICDGVLNRLAADDCESLIVVNFANGDMVGHTGLLEAAIKGVETVDACVGKIVDATLARGGSLIITADHGNVEQMWEPANDCPHTAHTVYDVPLHVVGEAFANAELAEGGRLADIAPTALQMMGLNRPQEMTGRSLLRTLDTSSAATGTAAERGA